eukprot:Plantae.Rhodophyta-Purpureofilum_apyrenoidigerum.ctg16366.p1 GENE.Plantae.Rhodophyta-Purpureofilum_apyrenoidigerum.ctg16366~~Plantae.Rhodophyta-Purpureofilum_apyrenoidigerum.ctg16366.p1  ORF type:complete len:349 (-),score=30.18 Plantae.Rhodophyta-Purpureofilum_apyrenoidigerum.ctg16366:155-1201(-)
MMAVIQQQTWLEPAMSMVMSSAGVLAVIVGLTMAWMMFRYFVRKSGFGIPAPARSIGDWIVFTVPRIYGVVLFFLASMFIFGSAAVYFAVLSPLVLRTSGDESSRIDVVCSAANFGLTVSLFGGLMFNFVLVKATEPGRPDPIDPENISFCTTCDTARQARTHHCYACNRCVRRLEHHCVWLNRCIGERNFRYFWLFLFFTWTFYSLVALNLSALYQTIDRAVSLVDSGCGDISGKGEDLIDPDTCEFLSLSGFEQTAVEWVQTSASALGLFCFLFWLLHCFLALTNQTTIELVMNFSSHHSIRDILTGKNAYNQGWRRNFAEMMNTTIEEPIWRVMLPKFPPQPDPL